MCACFAEITVTPVTTATIPTVATVSALTAVPTTQITGIIIVVLAHSIGLFFERKLHRKHRPFNIRTDGDRSRVCELGYIRIVIFITVTLSNVVRLLQNFVHIVSHTTYTNAANLVTMISIFVCAYIVAKLYLLTHTGESKHYTVS